MELLVGIVVLFLKCKMSCGDFTIPPTRSDHEAAHLDRRASFYTGKPISILYALKPSLNFLPASSLSSSLI